MTDASHRNEKNPEKDDELFDELAAAIRPLAAPPSDDELGAAREARDRVGRDEPRDLADCAFDSLLDDALAVRGAGLAEARRLAFYADDSTLHVEVTADQLTCRLDVPGPARVTLVTLDGTRYPLRSAGGDVHDIDDPPGGTLRLECDGADANIVTAWFRL